ncbi:MAG: nucleotidyltransferase domain-containing protein [Planctomycetaceae bacterium]|nr:nucleotidyltransferase domain-containing protein [Planctomycetaceae bacterium]
MDKQAVLKIISEFRSLLESKGIKSQKLILFGSFAKGNFHQESDIDLVVISKDFENKNYWERIEILSEAIYEMFKPIEAVAMTPDEWEQGDSMIVDYARGGEVVYG